MCRPAVTYVGNVRYSVAMSSDEAEAYSAQIADHLRVMQITKHVSQQRLADAAGVHRSTVSEWLNNHTPITASALYDLCGPLGTTPEEVFSAVRKSMRATD